jgi:phosphoribosyl 1,2-cyclic phosphate phosphodiesterase
MKITFLGTGTSQGVPLIACDCVVCKSVNEKDKRLRSSILIEHNDSIFVIDSGPDFRQQLLRAEVKKLNAVIFTHEHKDHIAGLDDVRAFNYLHKKPVDIWATKQVQEAIKREFAYAFSEIKYPGIPELKLNEITNEPFTINQTQFLPIDVLHYRLPVKAFRIDNFAYVTDANHISSSEKLKLKNLDVLVINALRKEKHISHFTFQEAIEIANEIGAKKTYFTHMSHQLGLHDEVSKELPSSIDLAFDGMKIEIE